MGVLGMTEHPRGESRAPSLNIQSLIIWAVMLAVSTAIQWGLLSARTDENARRIATLETQTVRRDEFDDMRTELRERLVRIEAKVDESARLSEK